MRFILVRATALLKTIGPGDMSVTALVIVFVSGEKKTNAYPLLTSSAFLYTQGDIQGQSEKQS